jgi:hypothetical protein
MQKLAQAAKAAPFTWVKSDLQQAARAAQGLHGKRASLASWAAFSYPFTFRQNMKIKGVDCSLAEFEILQTADRDKPLTSDALFDAVAQAKDVFGATITGYGHKGEAFELESEPEPEPPIVLRKCIVCGVDYYNWPESEYCSIECAGDGHRKYSNPSKDRLKLLRQQCRATWQRASERVAPEESFWTWLRNFEAFIERMRVINPNPTVNENEN